MTGRVRAAVAALAVVAGLAACGSKSSAPSGPAPELTGLSTVPSDADVLIGVEVARLANSPLVERAVDQVLMRDPLLQGRWDELKEVCKIDFVTQVRRVMLALGPTPAGGRPGTGPVLMVATGNLVENDLTACIGKLVGKGQGTVTGKDAGGRTLYTVKDGARTMFMAFSRADTVVLGTDEAYVTQAIGPGKKALDHPELAAWLKLANQNAPVWAVGRVDERVKANLIKVIQGQIKAGPSAIVGSIDLSNGAKVDARAVMASADDAKALESWTNDQKALIGAALQGKALAKVVDKVAISSDGAAVKIAATLTMDDVNHLLSVLDGGKPAEQISPPPPTPAGSGSGQPE